MKFRLIYKGKIGSNLRNPNYKLRLRENFHPQIKELWEIQPLLDLKSWIYPVNSNNKLSLLMNRGGITYAPLVSDKVGLRAELNILLLRPYAPGRLISQQSDIYNQIKILIDSLKVPDENQTISTEKNPFYKNCPVFCLLEDDSLVTGFSVETDRLLDSTSTDNVIAIVQVNITCTTPIFGSWGIAIGNIQ